MKYVSSSFPKLFFVLAFLFSGSYFVFSALLSPTTTFQFLAKNSTEYQFLAEIFAPSANAMHSYIRTELAWDGTGNANGFSCPSGGTPVQFQNDTGNRDRAIWKECYATQAGAAGYYPSTPLGGNFWSPPNTYGGYGAATFGCEPGSKPLLGYNIRINSTDDYNTEWYACSSATTVPVVLTNNASCSGITAPSTVTAGQSFSASVTMTNSGGTTWLASSAYSLGAADAQSPPYTSIWGSTRTNLPSSVSPGGNVTFNRTFNAPAVSGNYSFSWRMVQDGVEWFGATCSQNITVTAAALPVPPAPPAFSASCSGTSISTGSFSTPSATYYAFRLDDYGVGPYPEIINDNYTSTFYLGTGIAGHTYDIWVHACNSSGCSGATHSNGTTNGQSFSCPSTSSAVNGFCGSANGGTTSSAPTSGLCSSGTANPSTPNLIGSTYSWQCLGSGGGSDANCSSNYSSGVSAVPAPTLTFSASPTSLSTGGGNTTLSWSTINASSCVASGGWSGSKSTANGFTATSLQTVSGTTTFTLQCWNSDFSASDTKSATVTVAPVSSGASADIMINGLGAGFEARMASNPVDVLTNSSVNVTWSSSGRNYCITSVDNGGWQFITGTSGNYSFTAPSTARSASTFQTLCSNTNYGGGFSGYLGFATASDSVYDQIAFKVSASSGASAVTLNFTATPNPTLADKKTLLSWSTDGTSCTGSASPQDVGNIWNGNIAPWGISQQVTLSGDTNFSLTCTNGGTPITRNILVTVPSAGGPSSASTTATVSCLPSGNCSADSRTTQLCSNQNFTIPDGCGGNMNCSGTRSCDYNWKEVAP